MICVGQNNILQHNSPNNGDAVKVTERTWKITADCFTILLLSDQRMALEGISQNKLDHFAGWNQIQRGQQFNERVTPSILYVAHSHLQLNENRSKHAATSSKFVQFCRRCDLYS